MFMQLYGANSQERLDIHACNLVPKCFLHMTLAKLNAQATWPGYMNMVRGAQSFLRHKSKARSNPTPFWAFWGYPLLGCVEGKPRAHFGGSPNPIPFWARGPGPRVAGLQCLDAPRQVLPDLLLASRDVASMDCDQRR